MDIYEQLGVKKLINTCGPLTGLGGSLMPLEVLEAMVEANRAFVDIEELQQKVGERIAQILGVEAALVTAGAAAGLTVAAACMAGADPVRAKQLPDTAGMRNEIVILRSHRIHYDQAVRLAGAHFTEVGYADWTEIGEVRPWITDRTAAILYVAKFETAAGSIPLAQMIALAKAQSVPIIVDAADELPPVENLRKFTAMGADLALFSGGKDLRGPQASGLIVGKKALIQACAIHNCPNYGVGRPMKVSKEIIVGLLKAIELYVQQDFHAEMREWERKRDYLVDQLSGLPHVQVCSSQPIAPGAPGSFYLPAAYVTLDESGLGMTLDQVVQRLREGEPGIAVDRTDTGIALRVQMMQGGEEKLVASRLKEILMGSK